MTNETTTKRKSTLDEVRERFPKDIAEHRITIEHDDGLFRHVTFMRPKTFAYGFHLTTWPGYLCISGDMGTFSFYRLTDMFEFFRHDKPKSLGDRWFINPGYWAEKCVSIDRNSPIEQYSADVFRERINEYLDEAEASPQLRNAVKMLVLSRADDEHEAMTAAINFRSKHGKDGEFTFSDAWEWSMEDYTHGFLWCLYAIAWGVQRYDAEKAKGGGK